MNLSQKHTAAGGADGILPHPQHIIRSTQRVPFLRGAVMGIEGGSVTLHPIRASVTLDPRNKRCQQLNLLLTRYDAPLAKRLAKCTLSKGAPGMVF